MRVRSEWGRKDFYTYVQLADGAIPNELERKLPDLVEKYKPENAERNLRDVLLLQPLKDIHLYTRLTDEPEIHGNGDGVYYLGIVAFFIIIIAWVNYVNLSTARSLDRGREVGLRKVLGSHRKNLILQFLIESFVINLMAMILAVVFIFLITPAPGICALVVQTGSCFAWQIEIILKEQNQVPGVHRTFPGRRLYT